MSQPPLLGLAAQVSDLRANPALLRDEPRDIELHDFFMANVLAGDWRPLAEEARAVLRGHGLKMAGSWSVVEMSGPAHRLRPPSAGFLPPCIALGLHRLDASVQVAGVDGGLHQHVLSGGELLAQLGVLGREGE